MDIEIIRHILEGFLGRNVIVETEKGDIAALGKLSEGYFFLGRKLPLNKIKSIDYQGQTPLIMMNPNYRLGRKD